MTISSGCGFGRLRHSESSPHLTPPARRGQTRESSTPIQWAAIMPGVTAQPASTSRARLGGPPDTARFRGLPSVERLASAGALSRWGSPPAARAAARLVLEAAREAVAAGEPQAAPDELLKRADDL